MLRAVFEVIPSSHQQLARKAEIAGGEGRGGRREHAGCVRRRARGWLCQGHSPDQPVVLCLAWRVRTIAMSGQEEDELIMVDVY